MGFRDIIMGNVAAKNARIAELEALVETYKVIADRAALISIVREGRSLRFGFVRNDKVFYIETYATMGDDIAAWKRDLLEPLTND